MIIVLLLVVTVFSFVMQSVLCKLFNMNYPGSPSYAPMIYSVYMGVFITAATFIIGGFSFAPSGATLALGLLNSFVSYMYNYSLIKATEKGPFSFAMIALLFGGIILPTLYSALVYAEYPSLLTYAAIAVMLVSFVIMNSSGIDMTKKLPLSYYIWCAALFFLNGGYATIMKVQSVTASGTERFEMIMLTYGGQAVIALVHLLFTAKDKLPRSFVTGKKALIIVFCCALSTTLGMNLNYYLVPKVAMAILMSVVDGGVLVVSLLASMVVFKEKTSVIQKVGMCIACAAMIMMALS